MSEIDKRNKLDETVFSYQVTKDGRVLLYWQGKHIKTLGDKDTSKFLSKIEGLEGKAEQLVLAKFTGNFKRGNER
jgi:hypothetical protein